MLRIAAYSCESYRLVVFKIVQKQRKQMHIKHFGTDSCLSFATYNLFSLYRLVAERKNGITNYLLDRSHFEVVHITPKGGRQWNKTLCT